MRASSQLVVAAPARLCPNHCEAARKRPRRFGHAGLAQRRARKAYVLRRARRGFSAHQTPPGEVAVTPAAAFTQVSISGERRLACPRPGGFLRASDSTWRSRCHARSRVHAYLAYRERGAYFCPRPGALLHAFELHLAKSFRALMPTHDAEGCDALRPPRDHQLESSAGGDCSGKLGNGFVVRRDGGGVAGFDRGVVFAAVGEEQPGEGDVELQAERVVVAA